jgi:putative membrane protein (TIGR04086 family)
MEQVATQQAILATENVMTQLKMWPIAVGVLVDTLGSFAVGVVYVLGVFGKQMAEGAPLSEESLSTPELIVAEILGLLLTAVGGLVAARLARTQHVQHGMAVGLGCLVIWLPLELIGSGDSVPLWYDVVSFVGVVPAGALGGYAAGKWATLLGMRPQHLDE